MFKKIGLFAALAILAPASLLAQSQSSATGGNASLWAGGEASYFNTGYSCSVDSVWNCAHDQVGAAALVDFNLNQKIGAEGEARWLHWNGLGNMTESTYVLGPRYRFYRRGRVSFWVKAEFGGGWITTPYYPAVDSLKGSFFLYEPGGTVDYRLSRHLLVRGDYEYQIWPSFQAPTTFTGTGAPIEHNGPLTPNGFSVGVMYRFLGQ